MHTSIEPGAQLTAALRALRERSGKTLRELERVTNASDSALSRYLSGRTLPPWPVVDALCKSAGQDASRLRPLWAAAVNAGKQTVVGLAANSLPRQTASFVGRAPEVRMLLAENGVAHVNGMVGVGKTTLALHVAHALAASYPDGQMYVSMKRAAPQSAGPAEAVVSVLRSLLLFIGVPTDRLSDDPQVMSSLWRAESARRRLFVVVDDVANADQAVPLLPGTDRSGVLLVGRPRLQGIHMIPSLSLAPPPEAEAETIFRTAAGPSRVPHTESAAQQVSEIVGRCGRLPLAVRLAATRLRHRPAWTVNDLARRLRDPQQRFEELDRGDGELRAALAASTVDLSAEARRMFRLLAVVAGKDIDVPRAAALAAITQNSAEQLLEALLDAHLLEQQAPRHYSMHPLLHFHAYRLLKEGKDDEWKAARRRLLQHAWPLQLPPPAGRTPPS
jgi:plasmid stability protein